MAKPKNLPVLPASEDSKRCAYRAHGERCNYPGSISPIVHTGTDPNHPGPWFCRWHYDCESPSFGDQVVIESRRYIPRDDRGYLVEQAQASAERFCTQNGLRTRQQQLDFVRVKTARTDKLRGVAWARKILDRHACGEPVESIALDKARLALPREPGEDAEEEEI